MVEDTCNFKFYRKLKEVPKLKETTPEDIKKNIRVFSVWELWVLASAYALVFPSENKLFDEQSKKIIHLSMLQYVLGKRTEKKHNCLFL